MVTLFSTPLPDGLVYVDNFVSESESSHLINIIDDSSWGNELGRRTQHYGFQYDYTTGRIDRHRRAAEIPQQFLEIARRLYVGGIMPAVTDQVIVNEYLVNEEVVQGISAHRDRTEDFGPVIVTLSLVEEWAMRFTHDEHEPIEVLLGVGSIAVMTGPARFDWSHAIPPRKYDRIQGGKRRRHRRVSLTFRTVNYRNLEGRFS